MAVWSLHFRAFIPCICLIAGGLFARLLLGMEARIDGVPNCRRPVVSATPLW
jgi:hypothetical protein